MYISSFLTSFLTNCELKIRVKTFKNKKNKKNKKNQKNQKKSKKSKKVKSHF